MATARNILFNQSEPSLPHAHQREVTCGHISVAAMKPRACQTHNPGELVLVLTLHCVKNRHARCDRQQRCSHISDVFRSHQILRSFSGASFSERANLSIPIDGGDRRCSQGEGHFQDGCPASACGPSPASGRPNRLKNGGRQNQAEQAAGKEDR